MPLRSAFIYLSRHKQLRKWMETSPTARKLAGRFVAGNTLEDAITACRKIHSDGLGITLDYLGENVSSLEEAAQSRDNCLRTLAALQAAGLEPNISVKLTQFGLDLSEQACEANVAPVVEAAAQIGGFVRFDMESSEYTDRTIAMTMRLHARYGSCGTVIQSYLHRSAADIEKLSTAHIRIRLCKGAYLESPEVAFPEKAKVDANYLALAQALLDHGTYPGMATHDEKMIAGVKSFVAAHNIARDRFEFQMLYGIRRDLQRQLIAEGYRVRLYVPYGDAWYPYFMRRLAERPANVFFIARNMLRN